MHSPRKKLAFLLSFLFVSMLLPAQPALTERPPKREVRAVWITIFHNMDWPKTRAVDDVTRQQQQEELCQMLDQCKEAGINTVLMQTRVGACTLYPSKIEPWHKSLTGTEDGDPGYDPLAFAVKECHKRGMEIQCWIAAIPVGAYNGIGARRLREKGFPMRRFQPGTYLDPSYEEVPGYLASLCGEMVSRYDVDGIHLDFIRYSELWPRADSAEEADRRRGYITAIVRRIHDTVKAIKPWVKMSCSPLGKYADLPRYSSRDWNARDRVFQEAQAWLKQGLMDQLYPMMYYQGNNFYPFAADWKENSCGRTVAAGLGTYFLDPREGHWQLPDVAREMMVVRQLGLGTAHFSAINLVRNQKGILDFTTEFYSPYPALVPAMMWASQKKPAQPTHVELSHGLLKWQGRAPYYNVYVSDVYPVDVSDARNLLMQRYEGKSLDVRGGRQHAPHLYFAVTAMDHYGNESAATQSHDLVESENLLANDGRTLSLPDDGRAPTASFYCIESMQGVKVRQFLNAYESAIDISGLPAGAYMLYTQPEGKKRARLVGPFMVKMKQ